MKQRNLTWIAVWVLLGAVCLNGALWADSATVTFSFGKIEVLKAGEQAWAFVEKGTDLSGSDLVRLPPFSLLRVQASDGVPLPTLPGGREIFVSALIAEGIERRGDNGDRDNFDGSPAIDVLPLGKQTSAAPETPHVTTETNAPVTEEALEALRAQLDMLPEDIEAIIPKLLLTPLDETVTTYPTPRFQRARKLYDVLRDAERLSALTYAQVLRRAGIDVDLVKDAQNQLMVIFDSGITSTETRQLTANQQLIHERDEAETAWIPVKLDASVDTFITAWYRAQRQP